MIIEFPILESIKDSQSQHGLKYENYRNYRSYCSRRLHRIRRSLNVHQGVAPSAKARHQRGRKLMDVSNAMVLEAGEKNQEYAERMLIIPLCLAERAWAYAMQLKQEVSEQPRRRFHLIRRLEKAAQHATRFEKLCHDPESPCTDRTKKEATAYSAYMNGLYQLERENWADSKENLTKALTIYLTLCLSVKLDNVLEAYQQRIDELRASLRYCTFSLGEQDKKVKIKLPSTLQFHDIAFKHVKQLQSQEAAQATKKSEPVQRALMAVLAEDSRMSVGSEATSTNVDEDEEEKFEETREGIDEDDQYSDSDESDEDDDDKKRQQQSRGGVTGLVKGWLGGAWS